MVGQLFIRNVQLLFSVMVSRLSTCSRSEGELGISGCFCLIGTNARKRAFLNAFLKTTPYLRVLISLVKSHDDSHAVGIIV